MKWPAGAASRSPRTVGVPSIERPAPLLRRLAPTAAWTALAISLASLVGAVVLAIGNAAVVEGSTSGMELIWGFSWVGFGLVGALLAQRRPQRPIGWILLGIPLALYLSLFLSEYAVRGLVVSPGSLPGALAAGWLAKWTAVPAIGLVLVLLLLFPTGRIEGRGMRRVGVATGVVIVLLTVLVAIEPMPIRGDLEIMNPLAVTALGDAMVTATYAVGYTLFALALAIAVDIVRRWRRARGLERQQFRWFAAAVAAFPVMFVVTVVISDTVAASWGWDPVVLAFFFGMNGIAAAIGIAVTRYRLYDVDRVVSRTVGYGLLTLVLVGVYAAGVLGMGGLVRSLAGNAGEDLVVAASTLVVAGVFGPARRRIQAVVDRRFNRARYDAARSVEAFRGKVRDEVDLDEICGRLAEATAAALQPGGVSVWLASRQVAR